LAGGGLEQGQDKMIELFERAVSSVGLDMEQGYKIWNMYLEYVLQLQADLALSMNGDDTSRTAALQRVRTLYRRRLTIPLPESDTIMIAYEDWEKKQNQSDDQLVPKNVRRSFELAKKGYELRKPFEIALESARAKGEASTDLLFSYLAYIKIEEGSEDVKRVMTIYERALAAFPVTEFLWLRYGRYVEASQANLQNSSKSSLSAAEGLYKRALRNCPWVGELWARLIRVIERNIDQEEASRQKALENIYSKAMEAGLQGPNDVTTVVLAYLDTLRRDNNIEKFRAVCSSAREWLLSRYQGLPDAVAGSRRLTQYWADCEDDLHNGRKAWEGLLKYNTHSKDVESWLQYAEYERRANSKEASNVYKRCFEHANPGPEKIAAGQAWLRFEQEAGSAKDYFATWLTVEPLLETAQLHAWSEPAMETGNKTDAQTGGDPKINDKEDIKVKRQENDPNYKKRRQDDSETHKAEKSSKKPKTEREKTGHKGKGTSQTQSYQSHIAFVKHLPDSADEGALREVFGHCGSIPRIKMGMNKATNKHRGFAYIHFDSLHGLEEACKLNGSQMDGKVLFVAPSAPPKPQRPPIPPSHVATAQLATTGQQRSHPRAMLEVSGAHKPPTMGVSTVLLPRAATLRPKDLSKGSADEERPKSNAEFRKLLNPS
jgi:hypothetical protein